MAYRRRNEEEMNLSVMIDDVLGLIGCCVALFGALNDDWLACWLTLTLPISPASSLVCLVGLSESATFFPLSRGWWWAQAFGRTLCVWSG